jgi:carboxypeptidase Taq
MEVVDPSHGNSCASREAYLRLRDIFADFQRFADQYTELQPQKWLLSEGEELNRIVAKMKFCRREQIKLLSDPAHNIENLLTVAERDTENLNDWERGNLVQFRRILTHFSGFIDDPALVDLYEDTLGNTVHQWMQTFETEIMQDREAAFVQQVPILECAFGMRRRIAEEPARRMNKKIFDVCLDYLNPNTHYAEVEAVFAALKDKHRAMFTGIQAQDAVTPRPLALPSIAADKQLAFFETIIKSFLETAGWHEVALAQEEIEIKISTAQTGFCWGSKKNITLAVEVCEHNFFSGLANVMHECGHLLYLLEMNRLPKDVQGQPVAQFNGFGIHEFAAMFFEQVGLRRRFFEIIAPRIQEVLGVSGAVWSADNLYRLANRPNLDDTEWGKSAQVLTPNMAWRIEAERKILDGDIAVEELPTLWVRVMEEYTGIKHDPAQFMIRESHFLEGLVGYFFAYQSGDMAATMLHSAIVRDHAAPDVAAHDLASYLRPYYTQIRDKVFVQGCKIAPSDLLQQIFGDYPDPVLYMERLSAPAQSGMPAPDEVLMRKFERGA